MIKPKIELIESLPPALTNLAGFGGAALLVSPDGQVQSANEPGAELLGELDDDSLNEISIAAGRAVAAGAVRLERLNGPFPGSCGDAVILPLVGLPMTLVLIATNPAESAVRQALIESRQRYRDLIDASSDFVWETDRHGRFVFISSRGALGYSSRDMLGRMAAEFVVDVAGPADPVFMTRDPVLATDVWLQRADGQISCQSITAVPIFDETGTRCGARGMGRDVTEQRERERNQRQTLLRDRLMTYLRDTIRNEINPEKTLPAALSGTGLAIGADGGMIINGHPGSVGYDTILWGAELPREDGTAGDGRINGAVLFWCRADGGGFGDGDRSVLSEVAAQVGLGIAQLKNYREIVTLSNTDALTGLLNRRAFFLDLERRVARLARSKGTGALVYLDINNLKTQNDTAGHLAGDRAILTCAEILRSCTRPTDLIARIGGDEFLLWLEGVSRATAVARAEQLVQHASRLAGLSAVPEKPLGVSLGLAIYDGAASVPLDRLVALADASMYQAKAQRRSCFVVADTIRDGDAA